MLGLNVLLWVIRRTTTRDAVGGAVKSESTVESGIRARLGNASRSQQMQLREMGYESLRAYQIVAQPSDLDVLEDDLVLISGGQYDATRFIVRSVRRDNLLVSDGRSHVEMLVERSTSARSTP